MTKAVTVAAYAILGSILCWSRLAGLRAGYCCDEIGTVVNYVDKGPRAILAGPYIPNNHELFSMAGWATSSVVGDSAVALRLWSALPFLVGVAVVTIWMHRRMGALSGLLFLFLATASPLLLDITRMARGYGLAFLAMSVLIVAALELDRAGRGLALVAFVAGGVVGSLTLPHFAVAFVTAAAVLALQAELRRRVVVLTIPALVAIAAWYAPHVDDIAGSTLGEYGHKIGAGWVLTAPIDQTLVPAMTFLDDTFVRPSLGTLLWTAAFAALIASSPLLRQRQPALILCAPVVATVVAFWLTRTSVVPRFLSFLLVPLFVLLATGSAAIVSRLSTRPARVRSVIAVVTLGVIVFLAVPHLVRVPRVPRDTTREAAATIREQVPSSSPVFAHVAYYHDLEFHLGRPVIGSWTPAEAQRVCSARRLAVYVDQPYLVPDADVACTRRTGARRYRFEQYARGERIDVWIIPER